MTVPHIEKLSLENWQKLTSEERRQTLQDLENALAEQELRDPCKVEFIKDSQYQYFEDRLTTRGAHLDGTIYINEALVNPEMSYRAIYADGMEVNPNEPYMAVETLFHESRHAFQEHITAQPEQSNDPQWLKDFRNNIDNHGYLTQHDFGHEYYRWQPIEKDANDVSRLRTNELYAVEFKDNARYFEHHLHMNAELNNDIELAEAKLGPNYEEIARDKMVEVYNKNYQAEQVEKGIFNEQLESGEDHEYYFGYSP